MWNVARTMESQVNAKTIRHVNGSNHCKNMKVHLSYNRVYAFVNNSYDKVIYDVHDISVPCSLYVQPTLFFTIL